MNPPHKVAHYLITVGLGFVNVEDGNVLSGQRRRVELKPLGIARKACDA